MRVVQWLRLVDAGTPNECWVLCADRDPGARPFVYQGGYDELTNELGSLNPGTLRAFYLDEDRWDRASTEVRAQYFEFMAALTRMFAPKGG